MRSKLSLAAAVLALAALACASPDVSTILNPLPSDDFSNTNSGWGTGSDSSSSVQYANGGLQVIVYQTNYVTWSTPNNTSYENVHVQVRARNDSSDPKAFLGFVCDEQGSTNSFFYVGVRPSTGYYAFVKSAVAQDDVILKEGTSNVISSVDASAIDLGLDCSAGNLILYVNGKQIDSVRDTTYTSGSVGVLAASGDQPSGTNITFDNFSMTRLGN